MLLDEAEVLGARVYPVVRLTGAAERVAAGVGPQRCLATLELWESWSPADGWVPPSPVSVVGFVSVAPRWERALRDLACVSGLGAGMVLAAGRPGSLQLLEADASDVWVTAVDDAGHPDVCVRGRVGPVSTASRVAATRLIEEGMFAHVLERRGLSSALRS